MIRTTSFVHLQPGADPQCVDRLVESVRAADGEIDVLAVDAARTTPKSHRAGDVMLLGAFADAEAAARTRAHPYVESVVRPLVEACAAHVETVRYPQGPATLQQPDLTDGIQRTLLLHVNRETDPALVERFERDLADMPRYIDSIRNSALSRVEAMTDSLGPEYTHVWEQEFFDLDGLTGPYMMHGYHWSLVDAWFDAQAGHPIVDPRLIHASCGLRTSLLACG